MTDPLPVPALRSVNVAVVENVAVTVLSEVIATEQTNPA